MIISHILSQLANARLTAQQRQILRGRGVVAIEAVGLRLCFRLDDHGRLSPISPLVAADVTAQWQGRLHVSGDANLLRDVSAIWEQSAPQGDDFFAALPGGRDGMIANSLRELGQKLPAQVACFAPSSTAVADFNQQTQNIAQRCRRLADAVQTLEKTYV